VLRLVLNIILFLGSLLCVFVAPTFRLWIASIAVSEFPLIFVSVAGLLLMWSILARKYRTLNATLATVSLITFIIPVVLAYKIGNKLSDDLASRLGGSPERHNVFTLKRLFTTTPLLPYETVSYTKKDDENLTLDFYQSTMKGKRPCVVVVHGGSWCGGNSQQLPELNSELAREGFQVASINYRLAPKYTSPAPVEDIGEAIKYLKENSAQLKIDTNNFILLGRSAGGQLALVAAYTLPVEGIRGVVNFYGPTDMIWGYRTPANPYIMDSKKVLEDFLGGSYSKVPQNYVSSSPVEVVRWSRRRIPTLIIHGRNDALVSFEHGERLQQRLKANKIPHYMLSLPWATHGCDYTLNGPSGQLTTYAVSYFAKQVIQQKDVDIHLANSGEVKDQKSSLLAAFGNSGN